MRPRHTMKNCYADHKCITHHICSCRMARMELLESVIRWIDGEFGEAKIVVNGLGHTTVAKWLHLKETLHDGE